MPEIVFICMKIADMPDAKVPSRRERCKDCGAEVWMSAEIKADDYLCLDCAQADSSVRLNPDPHPLTRQQLRAAGWTEEEIEDAQDFGIATIGPRREG